MSPRVALIILCYNGIADTLACLSSLETLDYPRDAYQVVVVDNASSDGTPAAVRAASPEAVVIEAGANLGFAAGNNLGLRYALAEGFDYALLLNNDTEASPDFLRRLVEAVVDEPGLGAAGPTIYYHARPDLIWSAGGLIDWRRGTSRMRGLGEVERGQFGQISEVDFVTGCAILMSRAALERVGLLDERFFMYYEETEWCVRARRAGLRIVHVPHARLLHKIPLEDRVDRPYVAYYMTRNRLLFLRSTGAGLSTWLHAMLLQDLRTCLSMSLRQKWRGRRAQRDAIVRAWWDFGRGRFGPAGG
ncbi:MAG: glycosyltransferase family 2 protein [Chloroflexales bacterium]|nr:glycosyltransferase family 2 protein [Chloroflexales bacterium]